MTFKKLIYILILFLFLQLSAAFSVPIEWETHDCECIQHLTKNGHIVPHQYHPYLPRHIKSEKINGNCDKTSLQECISACESNVREWTHNYDFDKPLTEGHHHLRLGNVSCIDIYHEVDHVQWTTYAKFKCKNQDRNRLMDEELETSLHSSYDFSCVQVDLFDLVFKKGNRVDPTPEPITVTTSAPTTTLSPTTPLITTTTTAPTTTTTTTTTTTAPSPTTLITTITTPQPTTQSTTTTSFPSTTFTSTTEIETTTDEK